MLNWILPTDYHSSSLIPKLYKALCQIFINRHSPKVTAISTTERPGFNLSYIQYGCHQCTKDNIHTLRSVFDGPPQHAPYQVSIHSHVPGGPVTSIPNTTPLCQEVLKSSQLLVDSEYPKQTNRSTKSLCLCTCMFAHCIPT